MSSDFDARRQKATAFVSLGESSESLGVRESIADGYATVQRGGGGGGGGARDNESNTVAPLFFFSPFFSPLFIFLQTIAVIEQHFPFHPSLGQTSSVL